MGTARCFMDVELGPSGAEVVPVLSMSLRRFGSGLARQDRVGARANSSVVIPGREEIDPFVGHLVDQAVFAIDPA